MIFDDLLFIITIHSVVRDAAGWNFFFSECFLPLSPEKKSQKLMFPESRDAYFLLGETFERSFGVEPHIEGLFLDYMEYVTSFFLYDLCSLLRHFLVS